LAELDGNLLSTFEVIARNNWAYFIWTTCRSKQDYVQRRARNACL